MKCKLDKRILSFAKGVRLKSHMFNVRFIVIRQANLICWSLYVHEINCENHAIHASINVCLISRKLHLSFWQRHMHEIHCENHALCLSTLSVKAYNACSNESLKVVYRFIWISLQSFYVDNRLFNICLSWWSDDEALRRVQRWIIKCKA